MWTGKLWENRGQNSGHGLARRKTRPSRSVSGRRLRFEPLEARRLLYAAPDDPFYGEQYHHDVQHMNNIGAWEYLYDSFEDEEEGLAKQYGDPELVVGVVDGGFDVDHEDLQNNFETPDPPYDPGSDPHGTMIAGILAAQTNNGIGVAGTAGGVHMLPIEVESGTPANLADAFDYAVDYAVIHELKLVTTSLGFDGSYSKWRDPDYLAALDNMAFNGVLHVNGAGNYDFADQHFRPPQSLHVASTDRNDQKMLNASFPLRVWGSAYGAGIDLSAPGEEIKTTGVDDGYVVGSGTSEATPNAAGTAALVMTAHPGWSRDQVAAQLIGTTDDLDAINPQYAGMLGSGRVNSYRAVSETLPPPKFDGLTVLPDEQDPENLPVTRLSVEVANVFRTTTYTREFNPNLGQEGRYEYTVDVLGPADDPDNWQLVYDGDNDGDFGDVGGDDPIVPLALEYTQPPYEGGRGGYDIGTNVLAFGVDPLAEGLYRFTAYGTDTPEHPNPLEDPFGTLLDGDANGTAGGDFVRHFRVVNIDGSGGGQVRLTPHADPAYLKVLINGVLSELIELAELNSIAIDGSAGDDTFSVDYFGQYEGQVLIRGNGGEDIVVAYGSPGDDYFFADPIGNDSAIPDPDPYGPTVLREPEVTLRTDGGYRVTITTDTVPTSFTVHGDGGNDRAYWMGSRGDDVFTANSTLAGMNSILGLIDVTIEAHDFAEVEVDNRRVRSGGDDTAELSGSDTGDDVLRAYPTHAELRTEGATIKVIDFPDVDVTAGAGGSNTAHLYGSAVADVVESQGTWVQMSRTSSWSNLADLFDTVYVHESAGADELPDPLPGLITLVDVLSWDQEGHGNWDDQEPPERPSRWLEPDGDRSDEFPDDPLTDAVIRTDTVTVATDFSAFDLTIESGTVAIGDNTTLSVARLDAARGSRLSLGAAALLSADPYGGTIGSLVAEHPATLAGGIVLSGTLEANGGSALLTVDGGWEFDQAAVYQSETGEWDSTSVPDPWGPIPETGPVNDKIHATEGNILLDGTLGLTAITKLHPASDPGNIEWYGEQARIVASAGGVEGNSVLDGFDVVPDPQPDPDDGWGMPDPLFNPVWSQGHLGRGVFLTRENDGGEDDELGVSYSATATKVHLFQAADGDTNGDWIVNSFDIMAILASNSFPNMPLPRYPVGDPQEGELMIDKWDWQHGDFTGDGAVNSFDTMAILANNLFGTGPYDSPPEGGRGGAPESGGPDGGELRPGVPGGGSPESGGMVDLIVSAGGLTVDTHGETLASWVFSSAAGVFTGDPAKLLGAFWEDTDEQIGSAFFTLTGQHFLGDVIGEEHGRVDPLEDLTLSYTLYGQARTHTGNVIVEMGESAQGGGAPGGEGPNVDPFAWLYQLDPTATESDRLDRLAAIAKAVDLLLTDY